MVRRPFTPTWRLSGSAGVLRIEAVTWLTRTVAVPCTLRLASTESRTTTTPLPAPTLRVRPVVAFTVTTVGVAETNVRVNPAGATTPKLS